MVHSCKNVHVVYFQECVHINSNICLCLSFVHLFVRVLEYVYLQVRGRCESPKATTHTPLPKKDKLKRCSTHLSVGQLPCSRIRILTQNESVSVVE